MVERPAQFISTLIMGILRAAATPLRLQSSSLATPCWVVIRSGSLLPDLLGFRIVNTPLLGGWEDPPSRRDHDGGPGAARCGYFRAPRLLRRDFVILLRARK